MAKKDVFIIIGMAAVTALVLIVVAERLMKDMDKAPAPAVQQLPMSSPSALSPAPGEPYAEPVPAAEYELNRKTGQKQFLR